MLTQQNKKRKIGLFIVVGLLVLIIASFGLYLLLKGGGENDVMEDDLSGRMLANHTISYEENGMIRLYDLKEEKKVDEFDLVTLSKVEKQEEKVIVKEKVKPKKEEKPKAEEKNETYKNFDQIKVTIIKYDNAWNIQTALTPTRDTTEMLRYVRELNDGYEMHPIFPGEEYVFLKEKGDVDIDEEEIGIVIEEVIEAEPEYIEKEEVKVVEKREDSYIYYRDFKNKTLYAHSDFNNEIYAISVGDNGKLEVNTHLQHEDIGEPTKFLVSNDDVFFAYKKEPTIYHLHDGKIEKVKLYGKPTNWTATKEKLVYTYGDFVGSYDLKDHKQQKELLGDKTKDLVLHDKAIYVLNKYGEKSENNLLMKIDPKTLLIDDLVELKTKDTSIISKGDGEFLWVSGVEKIGSGEGKQTKESKVFNFNTENFKRDKKKDWKAPYVIEGQVFDGYIYSKEKDSMKAYKERSEVESLNMKIEGESILVIQ